MDSRPIRILVVDDEQRFLENVAKLLPRRGFEVLPAADGHQALETVRTDQGIDVVVLDVKMPGMDGIAVLKEIKRLSPDLEVIMLTGHASVDSGTQAIRCGAFDYLMKPCDIENLIEKIKEAHQVEQIKRRPLLWPRNRVKDVILYSFIELLAEDPLTKSLAAFNRKGSKMAVEEVFIQDRAGIFQGILTKKDLIGEAEKAHPGRSFTWDDLRDDPGLLPDKKIEAVMRRGRPLTAAPDESLPDAAARMIASQVRCMPVIDQGKVIGIVRLRDILQHVEHETE